MTEGTEDLFLAVVISAIAIVAMVALVYIILTDGKLGDICVAHRYQHAHIHGTLVCVDDDGKVFLPQVLEPK